MSNVHKQSSEHPEKKILNGIAHGVLFAALALDAYEGVAQLPDKIEAQYRAQYVSTFLGPLGCLGGTSYDIPPATTKIEGANPKNWYVTHDPVSLTVTPGNPDLPPLHLRPTQGYDESAHFGPADIPTIQTLAVLGCGK